MLQLLFHTLKIVETTCRYLILQKHISSVQTQAGKICLQQLYHYSTPNQKHFLYLEYKMQVALFRMSIPPKQEKLPNHQFRSEERRVGKESTYTRSKRDWSSDVCSSDLETTCRYLILQKHISSVQTQAGKICLQQLYHYSTPNQKHFLYLEYKMQVALFRMSIPPKQEKLPNHQF